MALRFGIGAAALLLLGAGAAWILSLPAAAPPSVPPPLARGEADSMIAALRPPRPRRPVIAIIGINDATETTDYLMPYGILRRADVADVTALATRPGPMRLFPALTVQPQATIGEFDVRHPEGADYVIVPAMSRDDDPEAVSWIRRQAEKGAIIVGVCAGAKVVAAAGLLDDRRATTHWYYRAEMLDRHPKIVHVPDRRIVVDRGVATTTGITASMPMMLTLIEAIADRGRAEAVARDLGLNAWDARHDSRAFRLTRPFALTVIGNRAVFWNHEQLGLELIPGMDEISLALVADAWSRTYRSRALTFAGSSQPTRGGLLVYPDRVDGDWPRERRLETAADRRPQQALEAALQSIAGRYGKPTARLVAMQLEYPWLPPS